MKKFYCEKLMFVVNSYTAGVFNKHCLLTLFSLLLLLFSLTSLSRLFLAHMARANQVRKRENPEKNRAMYTRKKNMLPVRGSKPHQTQR